MSCNVNFRYNFFTTDLFQADSVSLIFTNESDIATFRNHKYIFNKFHYLIAFQIDLSHFNGMVFIKIDMRLIINGTTKIYKP